MCGIVGITGVKEASEKVHQGLLILQHRGQDSAGITSHDYKSAKFYTHKDLGQVSQVFAGPQLAKLYGEVAIGHTRYSTIGEIKECDLQPMMVSYPYTVSMAHNGNLSIVAGRNYRRAGTGEINILGTMFTEQIHNLA